MKISFIEGGDFHVEPSADDQAHTREAVAEKTVRRYGQQSVYFNAHRHGSFSNFERSPDYGTSKVQIRKNLDVLGQFLGRKQNTDNQATLAQIEEFGKRVESGSTGFFSARVELVHSTGKEALEQLAYNIENPTIDEAKREAFLKDLAPGLIVCADGAISNLIMSARQLELESTDGLQFNTEAEWKNMLTQSILEFARGRFGIVQNYRNNEIHYHNAFWNHLASKYGTDRFVDTFIPSLHLSYVDLDACMRYVNQQVTPGRLVYHVAENCLTEIRTRFDLFANRLLSCDEVWDFYRQFDIWAQTELRERFGVLAPETLFVNQENEDGETVYRMTHDPALLMQTIGKNLVDSKLLCEFPVRVLSSQGHERIMALSQHAFLVHNTAEKQNRSLLLNDLAGLGDAITPQIVMAALRNMSKQELAGIPADRMTNLLENQSVPSVWLAQLSEPAVRQYRDSRPDAETILFARVSEKMEGMTSDQFDRILLGAAKTGDERLAAYLADALRIVRAFDDHGNTALHYAASQGMVQLVERLAKKMEFDSSNLDTLTPVMLAARNGHGEAIRALKAAGANVERTDRHGQTALMFAAWKGHAETIYALKTAGADVEQTKADGVTALIMAAVANRPLAIKALRECGANLEKRELRGRSALLVAAHLDNREAIAALLACGADMTATDPRGYSALLIAAERNSAAAIAELAARGIDMGQVTPQGATALMIAATHGHVAAIEALAAEGVNLACVSILGMTPLMYASQNGHAAAIRALKAAGADVNFANARSATALMYAAKHGHVAAIEALVACGAQVDFSPAEGVTALMFAAQKGHAAAIETLVACGAQVNFATHTGVTALMIATGQNHFEAIHMLISKRAKRDLVDRSGRSALIIAADKGHVGAMQALLGEKFDVDRGDAGGMTALMYAVQNGHVEVVKMLLAHDADPLAVDRKGRSALALAEAHGNVAEIVKMLRDAVAISSRQSCMQGADDSLSEASRKRSDRADDAGPSSRRRRR